MKPTSFVHILLFSIAALLFSYTTYRATTLSFTHDECHTFLRGVRRLPATLIDKQHQYHLNTYLMKVVNASLGSSEIALRLPNLFGHILFLFISACFALRMASPALSICSFVLTNFNPYMLDFFSLARPYGLSLGLMMAGLYFALRCFANQGNALYACLSLLSLAFAVFSNYTLLNVYLSIMLFFIIYTIRFPYLPLKDNRKKLLMVTTLVSFSMLAILVPILLEIKSADYSYIEGKGSIKGTLHGIVFASLYGLDYGTFTITIVKTLMLCILIVSLITGVINLIQNRLSSDNIFHILLISTIMGCVLLNAVQHHLFNANYFFRRQAVFYLPLFALTCTYLCNHIHQKNNKIQYLLLVFVLPVIFHTASAMNFTYTLDWKYDADTKKMLALLDAEQNKDEGGKFNITIGVPFIFEHSVNYYRTTQNMNWLNPALKLMDYDIKADFYYLPVNQAEDFRSSQTCSMLAEFPISEAVLLKADGVIEYHLLKHSFFNFEDSRPDFPPSIISDESAFSGKNSNKITGDPGFSFTFSDTLKKEDISSPVLVSVKVMVYSEYIPVSAGIAVSCQSGDSTYFWQCADLSDYLTLIRRWQEAYFSCTLPVPKTGADILKVFLFKNGKQKLYMDDLEVKVIVSQTGIL